MSCAALKPHVVPCGGDATAVTCAALHLVLAGCLGVVVVVVGEVVLVDLV